MQTREEEVAMTRISRVLPRILTLTAAKGNYRNMLNRVHQGKEKFVVHSRSCAEGVVIISIGEYLSAFAMAHPQRTALRHQANALGLKRWTMRAIHREIREYRLVHKRNIAID
jgi:hypothetical protein